MPTNIDTVSTRISMRTLKIRRPAFWVVFPLLLSLLSLVLSSRVPAYDSLGIAGSGMQINLGP